MRIATFNIHHAEGSDGIVDIKRTAEVIKDLNVDLVALQELDDGVGRSNGIDQPAVLADLLGLSVFFAPAMEFTEGRYGVALAARENFTAEVRTLPRVGREERRVAIVAEGSGWAVVATHLSTHENARKLQTQFIAEIVGELDAPFFVLGDLNQRERGLDLLTASGLSPVRPRLSWVQSLRRWRRVDHILVSAHVEVLSASVVPTKASDHAAFVAEIALG